MKRLIIVRHAKSSWKDPELEDHDRPLNKRGERDALFMAKVIADKKLEPDLMISSSARRALATAKEFARKLDYKKDRLLRVAELYLAETDELIDYIRQIDDDFQTVFLFGHNPGITWLVNSVSDATIENIPTCGICSIRFEMNSWSETGREKGKLEFFEYPKKYFTDSED